MLPLLGLERQQKEFLKSTSNLHITLTSFGTETTNTFMHSLQKRYPNSDQDRQSLYPFSDPENGAKTLPLGVGVHTYEGKYKGVPPGNIPIVDTKKNVPSGR